MGQSFEEVMRLVVETGDKGDIELLAKSLDALQAVSGNASKDVVALVEKLKQLSATAAQIQAFTKLKGAITETGAAVSAESEKLVRLKAELAAAEKPTVAMERAVAKSEAALARLLNTQNRQTAELARSNGALTKAGVDTSKLGESFRKLETDIDGTNKKLKSAANETGTASTKVSKLGTVATSTADQLKSFALKLGAVALAAEAAHKALDFGVGFITDGIKQAGELETQFAKVKAVTGATAEQMEALKAAAENAAKTTKFSTLEAAQALVELGRASGSAEDAVRELTPTLNLAQAAGIDVADAATTMVQTLAEFRLGADKAAHVADLLAQASKSGGIGLQGLADELAKTAPLAHQVGLNVDQTTAILAELAKEGVRGKLAAGGLKDALQQLADPFGTFSARLSQAGIETRDFSKVIGELAKRGDQGREAIEALSGNGRLAIELLVSQGSARIGQLTGAMANVAGAAASAAREMENTFEGAENAIGKTFDHLKEDLFAPVLIPLKDALHDLSDQLDAFANSKDFDEIKDALKETFVEGAKAAEELFRAIDFHALALSIKAFAANAKTSIAEFRQDLSGIITTIKVVYEAFRLFVDTFKILIYSMATAISGLLEGLGRVAIQLEKLRNFDPTGLGHKLGLVKDHTEELENATNAFATSAKANYDKLGEAVGNAGAAFTDFVAAATAGGDAATGAAVASDKTVVTLHGIPQAAIDAALGLNTVAAAADKAAAAQDAAKTAADKLLSALHLLGVTTKDDLDTNATNAANAFDLLVQQFRAGKLAIDDVRAGFAKYAEAQRAAVAQGESWKKQQIEEQLAVKAAVLGISESLKEMGSAGESAGAHVAHGAETATGALKQTSAAAADAKGNLEALANGTADLSRLMQNLDGSLSKAALSFGSVSEEAAKAYRDANKYIENTADSEADMDLFADAIDRVTTSLQIQQNALRAVNDQLDAQLAKLDPLADKINKLKGQYNYVDPNTLRAIAEKQQRVEDEEKRAAQEKKRAEEERQRADQDAQAKIAERQRQVDAARHGGAASAAAGSGASSSHHTIELKLPSATHMLHGSGDELGALIEQILERIRQEIQSASHR